MSRKKRSIPFLIYSESWVPAENKDIELLWRNGTITLIHEFDSDLVDLKRYFCPECGFFGKRTRREIDEDDEDELRKAYFSHKNPAKGEIRPKCILGEPYNPIEAELSGRLTRVREWLDDVPIDETPPDLDLNGEFSSLSIDHGSLQEPNARERKTVPRDVKSLQFIVDHIEEFLSKEIDLPGHNSIQRLFRDVLFHVSEANQVKDEQQYIFWGRVQEIYAVEDYVRIRFGYETHCLDIAVKEDIIERRNIPLDALREKTIAVAGIVRKSKVHTQKTENERGSRRPCYLVGIRKRGAFAIVKEDKLGYFRLPEVCIWVDPVSDEEPKDSGGLYSLSQGSVPSDDLMNAKPQKLEGSENDTSGFFESIKNLVGRLVTWVLNLLRRS
ncbi:hypothetical protein ACSYAD_32930 [Acaryochloris marina NIES-2412]|uniref:hypothetical protein n=1 Tax=Acaryochloris marina TaxID=155978 RepID=UPI00405A32DC